MRKGRKQAFGRRWWAVLLLTACESAPSEESQPATPAEPALETRLALTLAHPSTPFSSVAVDEDRSLVMTGSGDGVLRLWSLRTGALLDTVPVEPLGQALDVEVGFGTLLAASERSLYRVSLDERGNRVQPVKGGGFVRGKFQLSADGERVFAGDLRRHELCCYSLERVAPPGSAVSLKHAFSRDGSEQLVRVKGDGAGQLAVFTWNAGNGQPALWVGDESFSAWRRSFLQPGRMAVGLSWSPGGDRIAVWQQRKFEESSTEVQVLATRDFQVLMSLDAGPGPEKGHAVEANLSWSGDGRYLYAPRYEDTEPGRLRGRIRRWSIHEGGGADDLFVPGAWVADVHGLRNGGAVYVSVDGSWGVLDEDGDLVFERRPECTDFRQIDPPLVSVDGTVIEYFPTSGHEQRIRFSANDATVEFIDSSSTRFSEDRWDGATRSCTDATGRVKVIGGRTSLILVSPGRTGQWSVDVSSPVHWAQITDSGNLVLAGHADGTIRWYRMRDGEQLLSLFVHPSSRRWVAWTPGGYHARSGGAESLFGWQFWQPSTPSMHRAVGVEPEKLMRQVDSGDLDESLYRPGVVAHILGSLDEGLALSKSANGGAAAIRPRQETPILSVTSHGPLSTFESPHVTFQLRLLPSEARNGSRIEAYVDGDRALLDATKGGLWEGVAENQLVDLELPERDCQVTFLARGPGGVSNRVVREMVWREVRESKPVEQQSTLLILAIGVDTYHDSLGSLRYARKDARDFATRLDQVSSYQRSKVRVLEDPDRQEIVAGLDWLEEEAQDADLAAVFFAGHGALGKRDDYFFVPRGGSLERISAQGLAWYEVRRRSARMPIPTLFFVDTCRSGRLFSLSSMKEEEALARVARESTGPSNSVTFSASSGTAVSREAENWENGAFTFALTEGLSGPADFDGNGAITVKELDLYVSQRVRGMTGGSQTTTTQLPPNFVDFPIARVE